MSPVVQKENPFISFNLTDHNEALTKKILRASLQLKHEDEEALEDTEISIYH